MGEKIKNLKTANDEESKQQLENMAWSNAMQKAEGTKLKDDPKLLRKSIKRKEKQKKKSATVWKERIETVEKQKADRQKKRAQNLKDRKMGLHNKPGGKKSKSTGGKKLKGLN